jgi:hypothetical protein
MNLCKFVVDELHDSLSKEKYTKGCLLYCMVSVFIFFAVVLCNLVVMLISMWKFLVTNL